jgi:putative oxidoreductase
VTATSASLALLLFRFAVGGVLLAHGINHIFGGGRVAGTAGWFESVGIRPGIVHAWVASLTEAGAGTLLLAGLLTPLACAGLIGVMLVAWVTAHRKNGFFIFAPGQGWEYVMTLTCSGVVLSVLGAGRWSLDSAIGLPGMSGWDGLAIAAGAGGAGAVGLLATCWRPSAR